MRRILILFLFILIIIVGLIYFTYSQGPNKNQGNTNPKIYSPQTAWHQGQEVTYYDFGETSDNINNAYLIIKGVDENNKPIPIEGQDIILGAIPETSNSTHFWRVNFVIVPEGTNYQPNSIKSLEKIQKTGWQIAKSDQIINAILINENDQINPPQSKVSAWYNGQQKQIIVIGTNIKTDPQNPEKIAHANIYRFITGYDSNNQPQILPGQYPIITSIPSSENYTPLCRIMYVMAPKNYQPNSIRSEQTLMQRGYQMMDSGRMMNCVVSTGVSQTSEQTQQPNNQNPPRTQQPMPQQMTPEQMEQYQQRLQELMDRLNEE